MYLVGFPYLFTSLFLCIFFISEICVICDEKNVFKKVQKMDLETKK
jgi:hypothetical protein